MHASWRKKSMTYIFANVNFLTPIKQIHFL